MNICVVKPFLCSDGRQISPALNPALATKGKRKRKSKKKHKRKEKEKNSQLPKNGKPRPS